MNCIAPRPWALLGGAVVVDATGILRGRQIVGTADDLAHAVACVNSIHAAGITPAALAADPECVKKLVEAAQLIRPRYWHGPMAEKSGMVVSADAVRGLWSALRACGIEVGA